MYILKNAIISITRNKGRNILIGIIIIVISCAVSVTLAINNSSNSLIKSYQEKYEIEATLEVNRENMMKDFNPEDRESSKENMKNMFTAANDITEDDIKNYADSDYVKNYYFTISTGVNSDNVEKASMTTTSEKNIGKQDFKNESNADFTIKGYSSLDSMNEFIEGNYRIINGEVSEDFNDNSCLINSELATLNELNVGDTITIIDPVDTTKTYDLIIKGIYEEQTDSDNGMSMFANSVNTIITNSNFVNKMSTENEDLVVSITPTFILTSKDIIEDFNDELQEKGLNENLSVQTNLDQVENATSTISNVKTFAITFLIITLIIGTIVLLVINMINIRERKYEIGVLRTIGMKKSKVCLQFILELLIVSLISLVLGAGLGATMSVPVSNNLLKNEISASQNESQNIRDNFGKNDENMQKQPNNSFASGGFKGVATVQAFDSINATVDFKVLIELLGIGLLLTLISSISSVASIQKFSPLTILKER